MVDREAIYEALLSQLSILSPNTFMTVSRRLTHYLKTPPESQPSLMINMTGELSDQSRQIYGQPIKVVLSCNLFIYTQVPDETLMEAVGPYLNPLIQAVENNLIPSNPITNQLSLGGLVEHCYIKGRTNIYEGLLGQTAIACIPIEILALN